MEIRTSASGIQRINKINGILALPDLLIDCARILIQGSLSRELLTGIDDKSKQKSLAHRGIFPQRQIRARDDFFLIDDGFANSEKFVFNVLFGATDSAGGGACVVDAVAILDIPLRITSQRLYVEG